jgi:hypothetical protein
LYSDPPTTLDELQKKIDILTAETREIFSTPAPKLELEKLEAKAEEKTESDVKLDGLDSEDK